MLKEYVCGFIFSKDMDLVYLIRKNKPTWQKGKLNAIGGQVEPGESFLDAVVREIKEECAVITTKEDWVLIEENSYKDLIKIQYFATKLKSDQIVPRTTTTEDILIIPWKKVVFNVWRDLNVVNNILYLLYKAAYHLEFPFQADMEIHYKQINNT